MSPLLSHLGTSGASSGFALGFFGILGREERQTEHSLWVLQARDTVYPAGHLPGPPGINKPRENSHPGLAWINKSLGERAGCGELGWELGISTLQPWISPWEWMFAWPDGRAARVDVGI